MFPNLNKWKRHGRLQRIFKGTVVKLSDPLYSPRRCKIPVILFHGENDWQEKDMNNDMDAPLNLPGTVYWLTKRDGKISDLDY